MSRIDIDIGAHARPQRRIAGRENFRAWMQDLAERTIDEVHGVHFEIPEQARRILAAKGWKDTDGDGVLDRGGKPFAFELITNAGNSLRADATVMIQNQLQKVGIRATPRQIEFNTLIDQLNKGTYEAAMFGSTVDTSLDLTNNFHSSMVGEDGTGWPSKAWA